MFWRRLWEIFFIFFSIFMFSSICGPLLPFSTIFYSLLFLCICLYFPLSSIISFPFFLFSQLLLFLPSVLPFSALFLLKFCSLFLSFSFSQHILFHPFFFLLPHSIALSFDSLYFPFSHPSSFSFLISENMKISKIQTCQLSMNFFFYSFQTNLNSPAH